MWCSDHRWKVGGARESVEIAGGGIVMNEYTKGGMAESVEEASVSTGDRCGRGGYILSR